LTPVIFLSYFYFFQFNPSKLCWLGILIYNFFYFIFIWSSQSYDPGRELGRLIGVFLVLFLVYFKFHFIILVWLMIGFNNFFYLFSIVLPWSHNLDNRFDMLNRVDQSIFNMLLFQYLYKKGYHLDFSKVKLHFYRSFRLFLNLSSQACHIRSILV
jgi:hypothetical protein